MHLALWVLAGVSLLGAAISMLRPAHVRVELAAESVLEASRHDAAHRRARGARAASPRARSATTRSSACCRAPSASRASTASTPKPTSSGSQELTRLRDLLGLSLDELRSMIAAEDVRAEIRRRFQETDSREEQLALLDEALPHLETQLDARPPADRRAAGARGRARRAAQAHPAPSPRPRLTLSRAARPRFP